jgi:hypothetical protein
MNKKPKRARKLRRLAKKAVRRLKKSKPFKHPDGGVAVTMTFRP